MGPSGFAKFLLPFENTSRFLSCCPFQNRLSLEYSKILFSQHEEVKYVQVLDQHISVQFHCDLNLKLVLQFQIKFKHQIYL
jgi:hypothetical protein